MIHVDQTIFTPDRGNCFQPAVASIMELPLEQVPHFMALYGAAEWVRPFVEWLACHGWDMDFYPSRAYAAEHGIAYRDPPRGYSLLSGDSPHFPGIYHTVVALDGVCVNDPHPDRAGVGAVLDYIALRRRHTMGAT